MKTFVIGADGYIGRYLCDKLKSNHKLKMFDSFWREQFMAIKGFTSGVPINAREEIETLDVTWHTSRLEDEMSRFKPDVVFHLGQIPMPTYSMLDRLKAAEVIRNNIEGLLNLCWTCAKLEMRPHIVTVGTLGEFGYDTLLSMIDSGWFIVKFGERYEKVPTPRLATSSLYHVSKVQASNVAMFASKVWDIPITDVMQGPVYGARKDVWWYFDWISGTVVNRTIAQAVVGEILRYGSGKQKRAFISLEDSVRALEVVMKHKPEGYRAVNQFDPNSVMTCNDVISKVIEVAGTFGYEPVIREIDNPRLEVEEGFFEPKMEILPRLGFKPRVTIEEEIENTFKIIDENVIREHRLDIMPQKVEGWEYGRRRI